MARRRPAARPQFTLAASIPDFLIDLEAYGRTPKTIEGYGKSARAFTAFAASQDIERLTDVTAHTIRDWLRSMRANGNAESTLFTRYNGLRAFLKWAVGDERITDNPITDIPAPKPRDIATPVLSEDDLRRLLNATRGGDFTSVRDHTIIRLLLDTGIRLAELLGIQGRLTDTGETEGDLDLQTGTVRVLGKGRRHREVPFGARTAQALRRYLRVRYEHPDQHLPNLWLGQRSALTPAGVAKIIRRRGEQAGLVGLHPHVFRHSFAHHFMAVGGQEGDLMRLGGWRDRKMLDRYGASGQDERARAAHRLHSLGNRL